MTVRPVLAATLVAVLTSLTGCNLSGGADRANIALCWDRAHIDNAVSITEPGVKDWLSSMTEGKSVGKLSFSHETAYAHAVGANVAIQSLDCSTDLAVTIKRPDGATYKLDAPSFLFSIYPGADGQEVITAQTNPFLAPMADRLGDIHDFVNGGSGQ